MIFNHFQRVVVKLGEERYEFDQSSLMFTEVVALEDATGLSFGEWRVELGRFSIRAVAGLLHILRKRAGVPSDFETLNFATGDLDVIPLREDGTEMTTMAEMLEDINRRAQEAENPTAAAGSAATGDGQPATTSTSLSSLPGTESAPSNGTGSAPVTSSSSSATLTPG